MMRSMYSAVSGLKNHQTRMDVIGNNISNVNTVGYKKSRVEFKDALYQTMQGASSPTDNIGGTNPMGVGLGMSLASIDLIPTSASTETTDNLTDMSVDGNGYFVVANGDEDYYTRAGDFTFDKNGNLNSSSTGYHVMGWLADQSTTNSDGDWTIDNTGSLVPIDISSYKSVAPNATTEADFSGNLNSDTTVTDVSTNASAVPDSDNSIITSKDVYDSLGNKTTLYFRFFKTASSSNTWDCDISTDSTFDMTNVGSLDLSSTSSASLSSAAKTVRVSNLTFDTTGAYSATNKTVTLTVPSTGANDLSINVDLSPLTQYNTDSTAWVESQNGYTTGDLTSYTVGTDGVITGVYSNGEKRSLAQVALANFENPAGLTEVGSTTFQVSTNSGDARIGASGTEGLGAITPSSLEMSNVDLASELTDMITTERGFQANSKVITTSDEMLQTLVNLKQ